MRYEVIPSRCYQHKETGMKASLCGAHPAADGNTDAWEVIQVGWTVRDHKRNVVGIGRQPWATKEEADTWAKEQNGLRWNQMN